jgi:putative SOS response-associated peptidase YedK
MCNRYRVSAKQIDLAKQYGFDVDKLMPEPERIPSPELFPKKPGWIVRKQDGQLSLDVMTWGIPRHMKGKSGKPVVNYVTNVRNQESPFWRSTLANPHYRCLVPVTDFCEWSGEKGSKQEHWFSVSTSPIFSFAGIWRPTAEGNCYAFLTCEPNPLVAPIHPKAMPVIVHPEDYNAWLDGEVDSACALAQPFPSQLMVVA